MVDTSRASGAGGEDTLHSLALKTTCPTRAVPADMSAAKWRTQQGLMIITVGQMCKQCMFTQVKKIPLTPFMTNITTWWILAPIYAYIKFLDSWRVWFFFSNNKFTWYHQKQGVKEITVKPKDIANASQWSGNSVLCLNWCYVWFVDIFCLANCCFQGQEWSFTLYSIKYCIRKDWWWNSKSKSFCTCIRCFFFTLMKMHLICIFFFCSFVWHFKSLL